MKGQHTISSRSGRGAVSTDGTSGVTMTRQSFRPAPGGHSLEEAISAHGLRLRRRDLWLAAYLLSMSHGVISRWLGGSGRVMLPFSGPAHLVVACIKRRATVRRGRAVIIMSGSTEHYSIDFLALATIALPSAVIIWAPLLIIPFLLPKALALSALIALVVISLLIFVDVSYDVLLCELRRLRHEAKIPPADRSRANVVLETLAAYPRGKRHGEAMMSEINSILDELSFTCSLDARTPALAEWYQRLGYRTVNGLQMFRQPSRSIGISGGHINIDG
jgi:hypothetical protein